MGCAGSKQARRDRRGSPTPYSRSQSMPLRHLGVSRKVGDSRRHVVALTSSTLGSLKLDSDDDEIVMKSSNDDRRDAVEKAKAWSDMIERRMPKTIVEADEPETINAWELMEGLEEPEGDSIVSEFDPEIISNFRKALDQLSPQHRFLLRSPEPETAKAGIVKARISAFQEKIDAKKSRKRVPNGERKVVYYFTSLRGVRKTYEDCWAVRTILQGYGVRVDERDVSMHGGFKDELGAVLGAGSGGGRLPRVFADGRYLGGADEVRQMHEDGALAGALEGCDAAAAAGKGGSGACETCGDVRFVPCEACSGSCKVFVDPDDGEEVGGFRRCAECNENGLVRCPVCC